MAEQIAEGIGEYIEMLKLISVELNDSDTINYFKSKQMAN